MKTIGILGGMGPEASADLFLKILDETAAVRDQEHIPMLLDSNTRISDRTAAILSGGPDPRPELIRSAKRLERAGAELLVMACNTAHFFYDDIAREVAVPFLHMPCETAKHVAKKGYRAVALLATSGTVKTGVYADAFAAEAPDAQLLLPDEKGQDEVMKLIYDGVKQGRRDYPTDGIRAALADLTARGAQGFVLGCTELPLAFRYGGIDAPAVDPTRVLARAAVRAAGAQLKNPDSDA